MGMLKNVDVKTQLHQMKLQLNEMDRSKHAI